ncbi:MAG TPA: hypothetical protein VNA17_02100 [Pyrinomonadaceae bacterium]|nr:hypothetical protein [Pyrinomonadaceae bacterium]
MRNCIIVIILNGKTLKTGLPGALAISASGEVFVATGLSAGEGGYALQGATRGTFWDRARQDFRSYDIWPLPNAVYSANWVLTAGPDQAGNGSEARF